MEEKGDKLPVCFNHKLPDSQCCYCVWLEWSEDGTDCRNRKKMVCTLHIEDVFGDLIPKTLN